MANKVAIVGVGETRFCKRRPDVNQPELVNEAVRAALDDAELAIKDIDAVFASSMEGFEWGHIADHWAVDGSGAYMKPGMRVTSGETPVPRASTKPSILLLQG